MLTLGLSPGAATPLPSDDEPSPSGSPVRVTAVVADRLGRPVTNLTRGDFDVREDGAPQAIEAVEYHTAGPEGRLIALFLDEYHVAAGANILRARAALTRFVDEELRPADVVLVMKPLDSLTSIQVARDRDDVRQAIGGFGGREGDYAPRTNFERTYMSRDPAGLDVTRAQIVLSGLRALGARLGALRDGRKAIMLVSQGFVPRAAQGGTALPDLPAVVRAANSFDVGIYTIDPATAGSGANAATLRNLAEGTGGVWELPAEDAFAGMRRMARDLEASYRVTYRSSHGDDGRFHAIRVGVAREGAQARARGGYRAPLSEALRRAQLTAARSRLALPSVSSRQYRTSAFVRPWFGMSRGADGRTRVTFTWEPGTGPAGNARRAAESTVVLSAKTADGTRLFLDRVAPVFTGGVRGAASERAVFEAPPGRIELEMTIEGINQTVLDFDVRDIIVPTLTGAATVITAPEVMRVRSAREFAAVSGDPDAPPVVSRQFSRTERLLIRVPAYGPAGAAVTVTARLLSRIGPRSWALPAMGPPRDGVTQFDLPLAPFFPGEYQIEFTATSPAGEAREALVFLLTY